ncbi:DMT family transporter [Lactococcus piscium]|uniref:DMT family transporter n=1 Tax=Pseudolactococcus carnosus TaxID=2749961 RepID=UPI001FB94D14|nr:DMT family transporter [Lactococcus carnosus]MCJ1995844.1 DMT family transporter [Lactococcus carnosus]
MTKKQLESSLLLGLTAFIWGIAFVAQKSGARDVGPLTFSASRYFLGAITVLPCAYFFSEKKMTSAKRRLSLLAGSLCGALLFVASFLQQIGIQQTTVGKAGFITTLYIIIIPLIGLLFKQQVAKHVWFSVLLALVGMYLLCLTDGRVNIQSGDVYVFFCAIGFACQILFIDYFLPKVDPIYFAITQFFVAGLIALIFLPFFEPLDFSGIMSAKVSILYAGVISAGIGYTMQIIAQKHVQPVLASMIMSLEAVFSLLAGFLILGDRLTIRELLGCLLVFVAIIFAQLPIDKMKQKIGKRNLAGRLD